MTPAAGWPGFHPRWTSNRRRSTSWPTWASSPARSSSPCNRPPSRPTTRPRWPPSHRRPPARTSSTAVWSRSPARPPTPAVGGRRGGGLPRRRADLAPGHRHRRWTYTGSLRGTGPSRSRPGPRRQRQPADHADSLVRLVSCPCSIFGLRPTPFVRHPGTVDAELRRGRGGHQFSSEVDGYITGVRFYKGPATPAPTSAPLDRGRPAPGLGHLHQRVLTGWQEADFAMPVAVTAGTTYVASYFAPTATTPGTASATTTPAPDEGLDKGPRRPIQALSDGADGPNGIYSYGGDAFPTCKFEATNYWVDAVLSTTPPPDVTPPVVTSVSPIDQASSVATSTTPTVVFDEPVQASTVSFTVTDLGTCQSPARRPMTRARRRPRSRRTTRWPTRRPIRPRSSGAADLSGNVQTEAETGLHHRGRTEPARGLPLQPVERPDRPDRGHRRRCQRGRAGRCGSTPTRTA